MIPISRIQKNIKSLLSFPVWAGCLFIALTPVVYAADDIIQVEAEAYTTIKTTSTHKWVASPLTGASGSAMTTTPNSGVLRSTNTNSPMLGYTVNFPVPGTYYVWVRGWGDTDSTGEGKSDSLHVGLDGVLAASAKEIDHFPASWTWSQHKRSGSVATLSVPSAGAHTVNVWMREDGMTVDKLILTQSSTFVPTGPGGTGTTNTAPHVNAGGDATVPQNQTLPLNGTVTDDGLPGTGVTAQWSKSSGPGNVVFGDNTQAQTTASFSAAGTYVLQLSATDGELSSSDTLSVSVTSSGGTNNIIQIEAEAYTTITATSTHHWVASPLTGASGSAMTTTPNSGVLRSANTNSPMLGYTVNFPVPGTYYVWVRGWGDTDSTGEGKSDSLHVGLDGVLGASAKEIDQFPASWNWSQHKRAGGVATLNVSSAGAHTLNVWMREDGMTVDKLILTQSSTFVPTGTGNPAFTCEGQAPTLRISEFLASNQNGLIDQNGSHSDWVEIYNCGSQPVALPGIYLTDTATALTKWAFPAGAGTLLPGEYITVFASGTSPAVQPPYHTNFSLKAGGEYLAIVNVDGVTVIDDLKPVFPPQFNDISYGRISTGEYRYFDTPTPGGNNDSAAYLGVLGGVNFTVPRGFYSNPFELALNSADPTAAIRYTLDGSPPTESGGALYTGPIPIDGTTVVRASAYKSGYLSPLSVTHTYLSTEDTIQQPEFIAGYPNPTYEVGRGTDTAVHDYEMDPTVTQNPDYADDLRAGLLEIPTVSLSLDKSTIFGSTGFYETEDIEVPVSMEILWASDPASNVQANAGIESQSHNRLKRSMRVNFRSEYGFSALVSNIMQKAPVNGTSATNSFDRLIFRAGNNRAWSRNWNPDDTTFTEDQFYRDSQIAASGIGSHGNFVHLYINGLYWGLYNIVERPDDHFTAGYLGGDHDDWFYMKDGGTEGGDSTRFDFLVNDLLLRDLSNPADYALLKQYLDVQNFADYLLVAWWTAKGDWPDNNFYAGNRNDISPLGATPLQYYAWDGEWSWDRQLTGTNPSGRARVHPDFLSSATVTSSSPLITRLWHALRVNGEFMTMFKNRVNVLTAAGGPLSDSVALARWNTLNAYVRNPVVAESAKWGDALEALDGKTRTRDVEWQTEVDEMAGFINGNAAALKNSLQSEGYYP